MSVTITTDIFCDDCPIWTEGVAYGWPAVREAREHAKRNGWKYIKRGCVMVDLCPDCYKAGIDPKDLLK